MKIHQSHSRDCASHPDPHGKQSRSIMPDSEAACETIADWVISSLSNRRQVSIKLCCLSVVLESALPFKDLKHNLPKDSKYGTEMDLLNRYLPS